jgi:hypothetical protein
MHPYHVRVIQSSLTRSIGARFADIHDEIVTAFHDEIGRLLHPDSDSWVAVPALKTVLRIVSRTSNRLFVGVELCQCIFPFSSTSVKYTCIWLTSTAGRNTDYRDLNIEFAEDVIKRARLINLFPNVLKP